MLHPSYTELMGRLNKDQSMDNKITSRYTIVIASSKRARQIIDGASPLTYAPTDKAVSIAVNEMYAGKLSVKQWDDVSGSMDNTEFGAFGQYESTEGLASPNEYEDLDDFEPIE